VSALGAGGMGEVYRARDTRLDRTVAIKVVASALAGAPDFRERFDREARAVAALNHPHICTLHDVGHEHGIDFLVMEHLEGENLADRLLRGPLPIADVMRYGIEIADALDKAHRAGIVHRDLKPANIFVTKAGSKLLDFGLAKQAQAAAAGATTMLPTTPANLTAAGTILGTFQYMAPEQLEGNEADARTDIFALGGVLYEMATGRKAFEGKTQASLIASIISREPQPLSAIQPVSPAALERVVRIAMAKDPDDRWQSARDVVRELKEATQVSVSSASVASAPAVAVPRVRWKRPETLAWAIAALASVAAIGFALAPTWTGSNDHGAVTRFTISAPGKTNFTSNTILSVSPDGRRIVFMAGLANGPSQLWVRPMDAADATPLAGTEGAGIPFWSPDSRHIGFFSDGKLKRMPAGGGPTIVLCDAPVTGANRGGAAWNQADVIVFQPKNDGPLFRVPAAGGVPSQATTLDESRKEIAHRYPTFLPDGKHFLYVAQPGGSIVLSSLDSGDARAIMKADSKPVYVPPGYLLFVRQQVLMAQRFDPKRLELEGEAVPVGQDVRANAAFGSAAFSASNDGVLAYGSGNSVQTSRLEWFDRDGRSSPAVDAPYDYRGIAVSSDATRAIGHRHEQGDTGGLWLTDLRRAATSRFTLTSTHDTHPVWSPDGAKIAFASDRDEKREAIFMKAANGAGGDEQVLKGPMPMRPTDWSPDGKWLAYQVSDPKTRQDVWLLPLAAGDRTPKPLAATTFDEAAAQFSPDGRYVAYLSNESRRMEIYIQSLASGGGKWQVSTNGGFYPRWPREASELYYLSFDGAMMAVSIDLRGDAPTIAAPRQLFTTRAAVTASGAPFAVTPDGKRFLIAQQPEQVNSTVTVVLNWTAGLPQR
jgi:serine/threonine protein kinase/Tol biopolymer transport system component